MPCPTFKAQGAERSRMREKFKIIWHGIVRIKYSDYILMLLNKTESYYFFGLFLYFPVLGKYSKFYIYFCIV